MSSGYNSSGEDSGPSSHFVASNTGAFSMSPSAMPEYFDSPPSGNEDAFFSASSLPTTETALRFLKRYFESYRHYVAKNPIWVSEIESALYWISYLLSTTRFHNSRIVSELLYSCSSLLTLFNDTLLRKAYSINRDSNRNVLHLQTILSFIEYVQVFLELTAAQMYGKYGKWIIISIVEIVKAMIRMFLLLYYRQGLTRRHYLTPLNRSKEHELHQMRCNRQIGFPKSPSSGETLDSMPDLSDAYDAAQADANQTPQDAFNVDQFEMEMNSFKLPSSGRVIRNIDAAPPKTKRMWITPMQTAQLRLLLQKHNRTSPTITPLDRRRMAGELIHILRPIAHLATSALVGGIDRWSPYIMSFSLDLVSLRLLHGTGQFFTLGPDNLLNLISRPHRSHRDDDPASDPLNAVWNWSEQIEIQRRYMSLFMYLLRSPFYDRHTKQRLLRLLSLFADNIPLFGRLLRPFIGILPHWQRVYFHVWNQ